MGLDELMVGEDPHQLLGASYPYLPADIAARKRVVGAIKDHMVVRMDRALLPQGHLKGLLGKGFESAFLLF
jgi:hypothetical protein